MIVTHNSPDLDAIVGTWLLKRFGGMADSPVKFLAFEQEVPRHLRNATFVDIGEGEFDHHHRSDFVSAATLVLDKLGLSEDPVLAEIADVARKRDHGVFDTGSQSLFGLCTIIAGLNEKYPCDPGTVLATGCECLDAIHLARRVPCDLEGEVARGIKFKTRWGLGIGVVTPHKQVRLQCHRRGFVVFVYVDPETGYRGLAAPGGRGVDFSEAYQEVVRIEPQAEWYLHFTKDLLICGSHKALNAKLSNLNLDELISLVRIDE